MSLPARPRSPRCFRPALAGSASLLALLLSGGGALAEENPDEAAITTVTVEGQREPLIGQPDDSEGHQDYRVTRSSVGSKGDTAHADVPQSITVVPERVLEEQNARTLNEVFRNVAGAQLSQSPLQGAQWPSLRGFQTRNFYRDGMRDDTFDRTYWLGNVERVEVLRGPASVLYGDGTIGGVVNVVSKKPLRETGATAAMWGGSFDGVGGLGDVSAKLNADGTALLRVIADAGHQGAYLQHFNTDEKHLSALGQGQWGDDTTLTLGTEYRSRTIGQDSGLPAAAKNLGVDWSTNLSSDRSSRNDTGQTLSAKLTHQLGGDWAVSSGLLFNNYEFKQSLSLVPSWTPASIARGTVTTGWQYADSVTREAISDSTISGSADLAGMRHHLTFGTELSIADVRRNQYAAAGSQTLSLYSPNTAYTLSASRYSSNLTFDTYREGLYAQDLLELTDRLKLSLGLRFDDVRRKWYDRAPNLAYASGGGTFRSHDSALSERAGLTYEVIDGLTPYFGYSKSFVPQGNSASMNVSGGKLQEMETGEQYEFGLKADLGQSVTATAAIYQLTRQNVASTDPATLISVSVGEQRSQGFEFDATWKLTPAWNLLLAYAYTDAQVTRDKTYRTGAALDNVALNTASLWSVYEIPAGPLSGLGFGGGVTYVGKRAANLTNTYFMPEYATVDLTAFYTIDRVKLSLNGKNVLDSRYYAASSASATAPVYYRGSPATVLGRIEVGF